MTSRSLAGATQIRIAASIRGYSRAKRLPSHTPHISRIPCPEIHLSHLTQLLTITLLPTSSQWLSRRRPRGILSTRSSLLCLQELGVLYTLAMLCLARLPKRAPTTVTYAFCRWDVFALADIHQSGWLVGNNRYHDEDPDRSRCSFHPGSLRLPWYSSRSYLPMHHRFYHHLVQLHNRCFQAQPP